MAGRDAKPACQLPTQLAAALVDADGAVLDRFDVLVRGATRMDPWVREHCPGLTPERCTAEGVPFPDAVARLAHLVRLGGGPGRAVLVAHCMQYDWQDVLVPTAGEHGLGGSADMQVLSACHRHCTCVNGVTRADGRAYWHSRIGRWIGPTLEALARSLGVPYDRAAAHDASYDVDVATACVLRQAMMAPAP